MKLLLCVNRATDLGTLFDRISAAMPAPITLPDPQSAQYTSGFHFLQHEVDVCETGYGLFQSTYKVTKALAQKKYHLALKMGYCNAYKPELQIGDMVNVIKDKPASPLFNNRDIYEAGLMSADSFPHFKEAFINMNNSYMNVLMPYKKVVSVTVADYGETSSYGSRREKYKADVETTDGLGFVYPCMSERQPFYQLCVVEGLSNGETDHEKARATMNEILLDILQKL
jgi:futalosine hydrolase